MALTALTLVACDAQPPANQVAANDRAPQKSSPFPPEVKNPVPVVIERAGFRFTASKCASGESAKSRDALKPEFPTGWEGVKPAVWRTDGTLELEALLVHNCQLGIPEAGYSLDNRVLSLQYTADRGGAACNCLYRLKYEISGVPRADYEIRFKGTGWDPRE